MIKDIAHDDAMAFVFREDPEYAKVFVQKLLEDGEPSEIEVAIRQLDGEAKEVLLEHLQNIGRYKK